MKTKEFIIKGELVSQLPQLFESHFKKDRFYSYVNENTHFFFVEDYSFRVSRFIVISVVIDQIDNETSRITIVTGGANVGLPLITDLGATQDGLDKVYNWFVQQVENLSMEMTE